MAGRPPKEGLDYFELDCHMDDRIKLIQVEFGLKGFALVVMLFQKIYGGHGYYCEWNEDSSLLFMSEIGVAGREDNNFIDEVISACIRRDIFSDKLYESYGILTSKEIQESYLRAVSKRESVSLIKEYLLVVIPENVKNVVINSISDGINSISDVRNAQRREDKIRVDKNRLDKTRSDQKREEKKKTYTSSNDDVSSTDVLQITATWNSLESLGIKRIVKLVPGTKRYQMLTARIKQYGFDAVMDAIENIRKSDFLQGKNNRGWVITFDWFVSPNNFPKVLEGNYNSNRKPQSQTEQMLNDSYEMFAEWAEESERRENDAKGI